MPRKVYLEITNCCNMRCSFCPGTARAGKRMSFERFCFLAERVKDYAEYLYFHLMGEPLLHPDLPRMIAFTRSLGMKPMITTNGTLLGQCGDALISAGVRKVSISLHAFEANDGIDFDDYLHTCLDFAKRASDQGVYCALRLWNLGNGRHERNQEILEALHEAFDGEWTKNRHGMRIADKVYLEWGECFDWPSMEAKDLGEDCFCFALRNHVGVLVDGSVVPCCMDHDGELVLGSLDTDTLAQILASERAKAIYDGFTAHIAVEPLCRTCGFAHALPASVRDKKK